MRSQKRLLFSTVLAAVCAFALWAVPVGAFEVSSSPCSLISKSQIEKHLGLAHVNEKTVIGPHYPQEQDGQVASNCSILAWSGSMPTTQKGLDTKFKNGTAALAYIRTWITDSSSPDASMWDDTGFQNTLNGTVGACANVAKALKGHTVSLPNDGAQNSAGYKGIKIGLNVCGVWDRYDSHRIIFLGLQQSQNKPVVKHFTKIANTAVSAFW